MPLLLLEVEGDRAGEAGDTGLGEAAREEPRLVAELAAWIVVSSFSPDNTMVGEVHLK